PGPFPTTMLAKGAGLGTGVEEVDWSRPNNNNPRGRIGTAEDIAGLSIYLASRAGAFTVGATITCDGGAVARS
ncbi:MAG: SDR family oxidoreductase, partial [Bacteroidetes bacterium]|nr:SDR family oxidoreductase [Bacteroidota bacterium]